MFGLDRKILTLDEALAMADRPDRALIEIRRRIETRFRDPESFEKLTHGEKLVHTLLWMQMESDNGGFFQYLSNSTGDTAELARGYLREIGAPGAAAALDRIAALFPGGAIPTDRDIRNDLMDSTEGLDDPDNDLSREARKIIFKSSDRIEPLLLGYVVRSRDFFADPSDALIAQCDGEMEKISAAMGQPAISPKLLAVAEEALEELESLAEAESREKPRP